MWNQHFFEVFKFGTKIEVIKQITRQHKKSLLYKVNIMITTKHCI